jgi:Na+-driven multidrug efflux pump
LIKTNSIFFQAVGKPVYATIASTIRDVICFVPFIIVLPAIFSSVEVILYAAPIADLIAMIVTAFLMVAFLRSLRRQEKKL